MKWDQGLLTSHLKNSAGMVLGSVHHEDHSSQVYLNLARAFNRHRFAKDGRRWSQRLSCGTRRARAFHEDVEDDRIVQAVLPTSSRVATVQAGSRRTEYPAFRF